MGKLSYVPVFIKHDALMQELPAQSRANVLYAVYCYALNYDLPDLDLPERIAFQALRASVDEAIAAYDSKCRVNQRIAYSAAQSRRSKKSEENLPLCI